jgi:hypothetical protein
MDACRRPPGIEVRAVAPDHETLAAGLGVFVEIEEELPRRAVMGGELVVLDDGR